MFCPKCGTVMEEGATVCPKCGLDLNTVNVESGAGCENVVHVAQPNTQSEGATVKKIVYFGLAAVVLIMFFIAAHDIVSGGNEIMQIESVGGKTLEEAYYQELGSVYAGYAMACRAMGVFFASVLTWLGLK